MDAEVKLTDLIAKYPNRWREAVGNPNLRGWFVHKMTGRGASMVDRVDAAKVIDRRANEQTPSNKAGGISS